MLRERTRRKERAADRLSALDGADYWMNLLHLDARFPPTCLPRILVRGGSGRSRHTTEVACNACPGTY